MPENIGKEYRSLVLRSESKPARVAEVARSSPLVERGLTDLEDREELRHRHEEDFSEEEDSQWASPEEEEAQQGRKSEEEYQEEEYEEEEPVYDDDDFQPTWDDHDVTPDAAQYEQ